MKQKMIIWWDKKFNRSDGLRTTGKFRVIYDDVHTSGWMPYNQAMDLAGIYGGIVQHRLEAGHEQKSASHN